MPTFAPLESQDVREYWAHEAQEFTPWLAEQIRAPGVSEFEDTLGLDLEVIAEEKRVGRYSVDLLAEVVENQLESSDHDHLGKSIAYAAGVDADVVVWIAPRFYDEHRDAMQWLNEHTREGVDLFALRLEVWRIGDSEPAVRLNPVDEPSEWKEKAQRSDDELTETEALREAFWTEFRDRIEERSTPLSARKPFPDYFYNNPVGTSGVDLQFQFKVSEDEIGVGILIRDDAEAYWALEDERAAIDEQFSEDLDWEQPEETRAGKERSRIHVIRSVDVADESQWESYQSWMLEVGEQFHDAFSTRLQRV